MTVRDRISALKQGETVDLSDVSNKNLIRIMNEEWSTSGHISIHAIPYIQYLLEMPEDFDWDYKPNAVFDPAGEQIPYLLNNATGWRGAVARAVKAELRKRWDAWFNKTGGYDVG